MMASVSGAQDPLPEGVYRVGNGVSPPRILYKVEPVYSKEAREAHFEGAVVLVTVVGADGRPRHLRVLRSLELGLNDNAVSAVSKWLFAPGTKDAQPVDVVAQVEVNFKLDKTKWHSSGLQFHLPEGATRPILTKVVAPRPSDDAATPNVRLTFDIDEKGVPVNIPIENASNEGWSRDVAAALSKWRFTPASKDGRPVSVSCTMDFVRNN